MADGIIGLLAEEHGYPYNQIPVEAFTNAGSGYQLGTLCGAIGVAASCIGLLTDVDTSKTLVRQLFNWYEKEEFPLYQPEGLNLVTTVADSLICTDSVEIFMEAQGVAHADHERKARCAGVTGDVARKTVELLNSTL